MKAKSAIYVIFGLIPDLGAFEGVYKVNIPAHGCRILRITSSCKRYQAEVAALRGNVKVRK